MALAAAIVSGDDNDSDGVDAAATVKPPESKPALESKNIAADGGDVWAALRASRDDVKETAAVATSTVIADPIMAQFLTSRQWLWRQWGSTIVKAVLPREVLLNMILATVLTVFFWCPGPHYAWRAGAIANLKSVNQVWLLASSLVTFTISFFLSQAYGVWRNVYSISRRVQGRLNDLGLLCAASAARDAEHAYTPAASALLETVARYIRLFNTLLYASVSTRFAPLLSPQGLEILVEYSALTTEERELLLSSSISHNVVLTWMWSAISNGLRDGRLPGAGAEAEPPPPPPPPSGPPPGATAASFRTSVYLDTLEEVRGRRDAEETAADDETLAGVVKPIATTSSSGSSSSSSSGGSSSSSAGGGTIDDAAAAAGKGSGEDAPAADAAAAPPPAPPPVAAPAFASVRRAAAPNVLVRLFETKFLELRATYATIPDELSGRMPLAYTQLVQILVDLLVVSTPFALLHSVGGPIGTILGTGVVTLFYSSVLNLAKVFLDPYDNEQFGTNSLAINVATLLQETNVGSERWRRSAATLPLAARPLPPPSSAASTREQAEQAGSMVAGQEGEAAEAAEGNGAEATMAAAASAGGDDGGGDGD